MQETDSIYSTITKEVPITVFCGDGTFHFGEKNFDLPFQITCNAAKAYISFHSPFHCFDEFDGATFNGKLEDGRICNGCLFGDYNQQNSLMVANCSELMIGESQSIHTIETVLLGFYFPHEFSFKFKDYEIAFSKSSTSQELAQRTIRMSGTVSEGNFVTISGSELEIDSAIDLLRDICLLIRPLTASEVYFGYMKCNNNTLIYSKKKMMGKLFGMRSNILESTHQYPDYLNRGLQKLETIDSFDKTSIIDIGHALATSAACGLMETGLLVLTTSLERLGQKTVFENLNSDNSLQIKSILKQLKYFLKEQAKSFFDEHTDSFSDEQQNAIVKSISRIQPWDTAFVRKIKDHLIQNNWKIEIDFEKVKELRDSLAHSGMFPPNLSTKEAYEMQVQIEVFLLVHVLDLVGFEGRISSTKDGWAIFPWKSELKEGKTE
ncbi:MAG: hypothetical protein GZ094_00195 [Mariniphaga sp.]|nr:hypothetical protein [Mariniphaga sp.]